MMKMYNKKELMALWNRQYISIKHIKKYSYLIELLDTNKNMCIRQAIYHILHDISDSPRCACGQTLAWNSDKKEYRKFCSKKCTSVFTAQRRKTTNIEKYGVDHYSKTMEFSEKVKISSLKKYGVDHYSKTEEFKKSIIDSSMKNYGVDHPLKNEKIQEKIKKTNLDRYGVSNAAQSQTSKLKTKLTNLDRYGVENPLSNNDVREKIKITNLEKYGFENPSQNIDISKKISETRKNNYYNTTTLEKLNNKTWLSEKNKSGLTIHEIADELSISASNLARYFHKHDIDIVRHYKSSLERIITTELDALGIVYLTNNRSIIFPYELDIVIPVIKVAIEINGGYWHNEKQGKNKTYHLMKTKLSSHKDFELWHFFDWEFETSLDIIISKIHHKLNISKKIFARKLSVVEITNHEKSKFISENHMQGNCSSKINLGLIDSKGTIYAMMTFGKSRFNKKFTWEMLRFCCEKQWAVIGGASKLFKYFRNNYSKDESIISYCNLRFSTGNMYRVLGFEEIAVSPPNYYYVTQNGKYAGTRTMWQKHKLQDRLPNFDVNQTEIQNMNNNGYQRIWDCGNIVFSFK